MRSLSWTVLVMMMSLGHMTVTMAKMLESDVMVCDSHNLKRAK